MIALAWLKLIPSWAYALVAIAALAGVGAIHERHVGEASVQAKWDASDAARLKADADAAIKNTENNRLIASAQAATNERVSHDYETQLAQAAAQSTVLRAAVDHGGLRLPADRHPAAMSGAPASPGCADASAGRQLPDDLASLLLSESARADQIADQLAALQAFVRLNGMAP